MASAQKSKATSTKKSKPRSNVSQSRASLNKGLNLSKAQLAIVVAAVILVGGLVTWFVLAATPNNNEVETWGASGGNVKTVADATASGGSYVEFEAPTVTPPSTAGAQLPISYAANTIPANALYVATIGNDANAGSSGAPFATVAKAISAATSGGTIIIKGGTYYNQGNLSVSKTLKIMAASGETPTFVGSKPVNGGWVTEGGYQYIPYTPQVPSDGIMPLASSNSGLTGDLAGRYQDQAWVGNTRLKQVMDKVNLTDGKFWVDPAGRLYMTANDVSKGNIEVTGINRFASISGANTSIEGLKITRFSDAGNSYGVIVMGSGVDGSTIRNVEVSDNSLIAIGVYGSGNTASANINTGTTLKNITINNSNWMGVAANVTTGLTLDSMKITNLNQASEFAPSPTSGAFKVTRSIQIKVLNSVIDNVIGHGLWYDQQNQDADIVNNQITNVSGSSIFYEISDDMLMVNNYVKSGGSEALKAAGSSGLKLVNNTLVGGATNTIGVYVDSRSRPGCSVPASGCSAVLYNDWDFAHPYSTNNDWMPRIDLMLNNIIAYPAGQGYCKSKTTLCITQVHASSSLTNRPIETIIHQAEPARNIPRTYMDGNVYANGTGRILSTQSLGEYSTVAEISAYLAGSPVLISGMEVNSKYGNSFVNPDGSPTSALNHTQAVAVPTDANINQYLTAGTKHFGVTYK